MRYAASLLIALICCFPGAGSAQGTSPTDGPASAVAGEIRGAILSAETGMPVAAASVALHRGADSTLVSRTVTGADGSFRITGLPPGPYTVRVIAEGFEPVEGTGIAIAAGTGPAEIGAIRLAPAVVTIDGITVTTERRRITFRADRNTYIVEDLPVSSGGSAVDVLRNIPSVQVDGENRISLRGDQNVAVQINGRTVPMRGEQMGNFLAQLPADAVESVEVITSPSARYSAEGTAGILNIVLHQDLEMGLHGGLSVSGGNRGVSGSGNLGYQEGGLTLFGSYGYQRARRETSGFTTTEHFTSASFAEQRTRGTTEPRSHSVTANAALKLSRRGALSANLILNQGDTELDNANVLRLLDARRNLTGVSSHEMNTGLDNLTLDYALTYKHEFLPRANEFTAELRFTREARDQLHRFARQPLGQDGPRPVLDNNATDERHDQWSFHTGWNRLLGDRTRLETGYMGTLRGLDDDLAISRFSYEQDAFVPDAARGTRFDHEQTIHAVYGVLSRNFTEFDVQAGLRIERDATRFGEASIGERFESATSSVFPSALVAFYPGGAHQLKLGYSKRIQRPNTGMLNPVGSFYDPLNVTRGNPHLAPEYTHAFELGYQTSFDRGAVQLSPYYRHTADAVRGLRTIDENGVTTTSYANVATNRSYGADLNGSLRLGRVNLFSGLNAFRQITDAANLSPNLSNSGLRWTAQADVMVQFNAGLEVQGFVMHSPAYAAEQGRVSGMTISNAAIRQKLLGDRASLTLGLMNPVRDLARRTEINDPLFHQETEQRFFARSASLTFRYNFGRPSPAGEQGKGHGG